MFSLFKRKKFSSTYKTKEVEYLGETYTIKELSLSERIAFAQFAQDDAANPLMVSAWLLSRCSIEFSGIAPDKLAMECGPGCINDIAQAIIDLSNMGPESVDDEEKK